MSDFAATRWTLVAQARGNDTEAKAALSELCDAYYRPVVAFLACEGRTQDAARELAHEFFAIILAGKSLGGAERGRGRFRSYLLGALKHFLADHREKANAEKRGGGVESVPLDTATGAGLSMPASADDERVFDRQWALTVIARALDVISAELRDAGKAAHFLVLKPWLMGDGGAQSVAAAQLGMSESAVKVAIHRLRQRFREAVKAEIARTLPDDGDVDEELRHLVAVLAG
jgi:DNA-directed RNA polymerase specialized sigma24 family protein